MTATNIGEKVHQVCISDSLGTELTIRLATTSLCPMKLFSGICMKSTNDTKLVSRTVAGCHSSDIFTHLSCN